LAAKHHNLAAVMTFVRDEISQNVTNVEQKVAPHLRRRAGNPSPVINAELQQAQDARAAALQRWNEILRFHLVPVDAPWDCEAVLLAERLDPHAPCIVYVTGKHPDGSTRCSRQFGFPELRGQMLDQKNRYPVIGLPRVKDRISQVNRRRHTAPLKFNGSANPEHPLTGRKSVFSRPVVSQACNYANLDLLKTLERSTAPSPKLC
jgi:hypothetical protein